MQTPLPAYHEAKTHLSRLIQDVLRGEQVIIARGSVPLVQLIALPGLGPRRVPGALAAPGFAMADDFDEPLDDMRDYMP